MTGSRIHTTSALVLAVLLTTACQDSRRADRGDEAMTGGERVAMAKGNSGADSAVSSEIERVLGADGQTSKFEIDVSTTKGVVTLSGKVSNESSKQRAEELAKDVDGVDRVDNQLTVSLDLALHDARAIRS